MNIQWEIKHMINELCKNCGNDKFWLNKNTLDLRCKNCGEIQNNKLQSSNTTGGGMK